MQSCGKCFRDNGHVPLSPHHSESLNVVPESATCTTAACLTLRNIMRTRDPHLQNMDANQEDDDHRLVPGACRTEAVMQEVNEEGHCGSHTIVAGKQQRAYLMRQAVSRGKYALLTDRLLPCHAFY